VDLTAALAGFLAETVYLERLYPPGRATLQEVMTRPSGMLRVMV
jgi:hypothetical protein